jgi:NTP pyrophosphatase (non-canonical NTP hydrolase)
MMINFDTLRVVNVSRLERWHGDDASWTGADWSNAMSGESGEMMEAALEATSAMVRVGVATGTVANTIKKVRRHETGLGTSYNTPELAPLIAKLAEEIADVVIYADLLANHYGIDMGKAVLEKFNKVSIGNGFPERLEPTTTSVSPTPRAGGQWSRVGDTDYG